MSTNAEWKKLTSGIILLSLTAEVKKWNNKKRYLQEIRKKPCTAFPTKRQKPTAIKKMLINTCLHLSDAILISSLAITGFTMAFRISCESVHRRAVLLSSALQSFLLVYLHWENPVVSFSIPSAVNCCSYSGKENLAETVWNREKVVDDKIVRHTGKGKAKVF